MLQQPIKEHASVKPSSLKVFSKQMFFGCLYLFLRLIIKCQIIGQIETNVPSLGLCDSWSPLQQTRSPLPALVGGSVLTSYVTSHPFPHLIKEVFLKNLSTLRGGGRGRGGFSVWQSTLTWKTNKQTDRSGMESSAQIWTFDRTAPRTCSAYLHMCSSAAATQMSS